MISNIEDYLMELYPDSRCELNYNKDYELLIAVVLSAQTTDKRVNEVTPLLFNKYPTPHLMKEASKEEIYELIKKEKVAIDEQIRKCIVILNNELEEKNIEIGK